MALRTEKKNANAGVNGKGFVKKGNMDQVIRMIRFYIKIQKRYLIIIIIISFCSCSNHKDTLYINKYVWKHNSGYYINDFIYFGDELIIGYKDSIFLKGDYIGQVYGVNKNEIIIQSKDRYLGYYYIFDEVKNWK